MASSFYDPFAGMDEETAARLAAEINEDAAAAVPLADRIGSSFLGWQGTPGGHSGLRQSAPPAAPSGPSGPGLLSRAMAALGGGAGPLGTFQKAHADVKAGRAGLEKPLGDLLARLQQQSGANNPLAGKGRADIPGADAAAAGPAVEQHPLYNVSQTSTSSSERHGRDKKAEAAFDKAGAEQRSANEEIAGHQQRAGMDNFLELSAVRDAMEKSRAEHEAQRQALRAKIDTTLDEVKNANIDPERYWANKGGLDRTMLLLASLGGGLAEGASGGRIRNRIPDMVQKEIDRDLAVQKANIAKKQSLLGYYFQQVGDLNTAETMARATMMDGVKTALQANAALLGSKTAQADATKKSAAIDERHAQIRMDLAARDVVRTGGSRTKSGVMDATTKTWATPEQLAASRPKAAPAKPYSMGKSDEEALQGAEKMAAQFGKYMQDLKAHTDGAGGVAKTALGAIGIPNTNKKILAKKEEMALAAAHAAQGAGQVSNKDADRVAGTLPGPLDGEAQRNFAAVQALTPVIAGLRKIRERHVDPSARQRIATTLEPLERMLREYGGKK